MRILRRFYGQVQSHLESEGLMKASAKEEDGEVIYQEDKFGAKGVHMGRKGLTGC